MSNRKQAAGIIDRTPSSNNTVTPSAREQQASQRAAGLLTSEVKASAAAWRLHSRAEKVVTTGAYDLIHGHL
jgi:hypothetical protein